MVLAQIVVSTANNNTYFPLPVTGKCSIRVLGVQYSDDKKNDDLVVQIQSDALYFPYSPARYLTILSAHTGSIAIDQGRHDYHLCNVELNGKILINVIDTATGTTPVHFTHCIISLSIEAINRNLPVDEVLPA